MIFLASSTAQRPIDSALLEEARGIEEVSPGLHILAARQFRYPVQQQKLDIRADRYRMLNLLERFILRAAAEVVPSPSPEELADALGLDPLFIKSAFNDLVLLQNITFTNNSLHVTAEGKKNLATEKIPESPIFATRYLVQDLALNTTTIIYRHLEDTSDAFADINAYIDKNLTKFPSLTFVPDQLPALLQMLDVDLHLPEDNQFVTSITPIDSPELCWKQVGVFVIYDERKTNVEEAVTIQARADGKLISALNTLLNAQLHEQHLSLSELFGLNDAILRQEEEAPPEVRQEDRSLDERLVAERLEEIRQQALEQLRQQPEGKSLEKTEQTARQLRDVEIRPAFLQALQEAREQIIIYSPWVNEQVIDEEFLNRMKTLVQKGVHVFIGYGIRRDEKREDRPIPPALRQRLREIQTPDGTPGVIAEWLGNSHAKEIIIDRVMHFSGSHNWLSYRGDRFPRGETVYQVTIAAEVEKAYNHLTQRFIERAKILWARAEEEERRIALCILCYLGHEQEALSWIQRDKRYHFISLWLKLARQAISAGHISSLEAPLQAMLMLCNIVIKPQEPLLMQKIDPELQRLFKVLAQKDQRLANKLIYDNPSIAK